jgi:drug/metabolite transporter (DMT)-like permease
MQASIAVTIKKHGHHLHPLSMNFVPMVIAGISMLVLGLAFENISSNVYGRDAILSILYLAFFGSVVTFTSYYWLLKRINLVILSLIAFITPIVALLLGFLLYDEQLSARHFIGSTFVLMGVLAANLGNLVRIKKGTILKTEG